MTKILHVVGQMATGGMETLIMNLYRKIDRSKVQFDILVYYTAQGEYDDEVRMLGGNVYVAARSNNPIIFTKRIDNFFREHHDYDVIHVHTAWLGWVYFLYARKYGINRTILHLHAAGSELTGLRHSFRQWMMRYSEKKADMILACSAQSAYYDKADLSKTWFLANGICANQFIYNEETRHCMRKELVLGDKFAIACTARFALQKNHEFLIDILQSLVTKHSKNVVLLLIGRGSLESDVREKVHRLRLDDYVKFLGVRNDVYNVLQAADTYVMPSLFEGLSIAYIEAQAAGLITFASTASATKEAAVTDLFYTLPLEAGADAWADEIWSKRKYIRSNRLHEIQASGFDICDTAKKLERLYVEQVNEFAVVEPEETFE